MSGCRQLLTTLCDDDMTISDGPMTIAVWLVLGKRRFGGKEARCRGLPPVLSFEPESVIVHVGVVGTVLGSIINGFLFWCFFLSFFFPVIPPTPVKSSNRALRDASREEGYG